MNRAGRASVTPGAKAPDFVRPNGTAEAVPFPRRFAGWLPGIKGPSHDDFWMAWGAR